MSLISTIKTDSLIARKAAIGQPATSMEGIRSALLVTLYGEASKIGKDAGNRDTTDDETSSVIRKFLKGADETLKLNLSESTRAKTQAEREILEGYLPKELAPEVLKSELETLSATLGIEIVLKNTGAFRNALNEKYPGQINGKLLSDLIKEAQ